jgi:hypothetical protein
VLSHKAKMNRRIDGHQTAQRRTPDSIILNVKQAAKGNRQIKEQSKASSIDE